MCAAVPMRRRISFPPGGGGSPQHRTDCEASIHAAVRGGRRSQTAAQSPSCLPLLLCDAVELPVQALHTYLKAPSGRLAAGKTVANLQLLQEARDRPEAFALTVTDQERREGHPESWLPELLSFPGAETLRFHEHGDWYTEDGPIGWKGGAFEEPDETGVEAEERFYLGSLLFYNNYQTVDRQRLVTFLLNLASVSAVLRDLRRRWPAES